jgi:hypothetical protein
MSHTMSFQTDVKRLVRRLGQLGEQKRALVELTDLVTDCSCDGMPVNDCLAGIVTAGAIPATVALLGSACKPAVQFMAALFLFQLTMDTEGASAGAIITAGAIPSLAQLMASGSMTPMQAPAGDPRIMALSSNVRQMASLALLTLAAGSIANTTSIVAEIWCCNMGLGPKTYLLLYVLTTVLTFWFVATSLTYLRCLAEWLIGRLLA